MSKNEDESKENQNKQEAVSADLQGAVIRGVEKQGPSLWLITFTDIMALMLTFFVLLYSMSVPEVEKWEDLTAALNRGFSKFYSPQSYSGPQDAISIQKLDFSEALNLDYLRGLLQQSISDDEKLKDVVLIRQKDRLILSLPQNLLFDSGSDEVSVGGKRALFKLGGLMSRIRNRIEVVGHTDPRPITQSENAFNSNWDLSIARAAQVSNILLQVGYRRDITVRGVSSARFDELPETMEAEKRLDLSRRVDIVVMRDDGTGRLFMEFSGSN